MQSKWHILAISVITISLVTVLNVEAAVVDNFVVDTLVDQTYFFNLNTGDDVTGSFSIEGGDQDLYFWITDPSGNSILNKQIVTVGEDFTFTAKRDGGHALHFENGVDGLFELPKSVTLTYEHNPVLAGGCLIATATYGSELSPQVQQLRELRDNSLLQTESGSAFMTSFNQFYYSFSPTIADWERQNPLFKEAVTLAITPLITSLSILNYVDMESEVEVLGYGISLIILNLGMYIVAPVGIGLIIRKKI